MSFFFNDTATTEIYTLSDTLSLHDALPICRGAARHSAAALHAPHYADHQRGPPLGEPRVRDRAAVRAHQVRGRGLDGDAGGEEGGAHPHLPVRLAAVHRRDRAAGRAHLP